MTSSLSLQPTARTALQFHHFVGPPVQVMAKYFTFFFYSSMKKVISNPSTQVQFHWSWLLGYDFHMIWLLHFLYSLKQKTCPSESVQEVAINIMLVYMLKFNHVHCLPSCYQFALLYYVKEELFIFIFTKTYAVAISDWVQGWLFCCYLPSFKSSKYLYPFLDWSSSDTLNCDSHF